MFNNGTSISSALNRCEILGVHIDRFDMDETVAAARELIASGGVHHVMGVNAIKIVEAYEDSRVAELCREATIVSPDGQSVIWASKILGDPLPSRVAGIDLMQELVKLSASEGQRIYLLGAAEAVVEETARRFRGQGANIVGWQDGYWRRTRSDAEMADVIVARRPDILFVGVPSPMKEDFISENMERMKVPLCVGVGGSFDVVAGVVRRAPRIAQCAGMEWFYRFLQEPRRLLKRYLVGNTKFIFYVLRSRWRRAHG